MASKVKLAGLRTTRERLWEAARRLGEFDLSEWRDACALPVPTYGMAASYRQCLVASGHIVMVKPARTTNKAGHSEEARYRVAIDCLEAPRVDSAGKATKAYGRLAMWRAMQVLKNFSVAEVAISSSLPATNGKPAFIVTLRATQAYVQGLAKVGFLSVTGKGKATRYRLVRNTGALAPVMTNRRGVLDRNTRQFHDLQTVQEVCDASE